MPDTDPETLLMAMLHVGDIAESDEEAQTAISSIIAEHGLDEEESTATPPVHAPDHTVAPSTSISGEEVVLSEEPHDPPQ